MWYFPSWSLSYVYRYIFRLMEVCRDLPVYVNCQIILISPKGSQSCWIQTWILISIWKWIYVEIIILTKLQIVALNHLSIDMYLKWYSTMWFAFYISISVRELSSVDRFPPKEVNLNEFNHKNTDKCIWIEISRCILGNMVSSIYWKYLYSTTLTLIYVSRLI